MRETGEKVYRCDFCNRAIVSAGSMTLHERMCRSNPKNQHQCFKFCKNLVKEKFEDDGDVSISFTCLKKPDTELYSYKLERFKSNQKRIESMERMPLECDLYDGGGYYFDGIDDEIKHLIHTDLRNILD